MNMKKFAALLLAALMVLTLAACGAASSSAAQGFIPMEIATAHTAPPVAREPSTVRSAISRIR